MPAAAHACARALQLLAKDGGWQWTWTYVIVPRLWPLLVTFGDERGPHGAFAWHSVLRLMSIVADAAVSQSESTDVRWRHLRRLATTLLMPSIDSESDERARVVDSRSAIVERVAVTRSAAPLAPRLREYANIIANNDDVLFAVDAVDVRGLLAWLREIAAADALFRLARERDDKIVLLKWSASLSAAQRMLLPPWLAMQISECFEQ